MSPAVETRARRGFAIGAVLGLALAMGSLLSRKNDPPMPADAVAIVNGSPIREADLERAMAALAADRRDPLGAAERRLVLDRLVEEELLVQRASELGLDRRDRGLRSRLVTAMVDAVVTDGAHRADAGAGRRVLSRARGGVRAADASLGAGHRDPRPRRAPGR
jgi:hypothetical protein